MLRSIIRILRASLVQIDTEIAEKCAKPQQPAVCGKFTFGRHGTGSVSALMGLVSLTFIPHPPWPRLISDVGLELEGTLINCSLL